MQQLDRLKGQFKYSIRNRKELHLKCTHLHNMLSNKSRNNGIDF